MASAALPPLLPGFEVIERIGSGGFADVYLCWQLRPYRKVAVKVLRSEHLSTDGLRQFEAEADIMARVSEHPFIVTIHDVGVAPDGRPFIVMERYSGAHFADRARGRGLPVADVLRVGIQIASAIETAHRAGIIHRDIKPANILTSGYGNPGLTDFGIAGVRTDHGIDEMTGMSIAFAPPEVLANESTAGAELSDIYSFSATLWAILAGRAPFSAVDGDNSDDAMVERILDGALPASPREGVPQSLVHLLRNGLAQDLASRPPSALDIARSLQDVEQELQLATTPIGEIPERQVGGSDPRRSASRLDDQRPSEPVARQPQPEPSPPTVAGRRSGAVGAPAALPAVDELTRLPGPMAPAAGQEVSAKLTVGPPLSAGAGTAVNGPSFTVGDPIGDRIDLAVEDAPIVSPTDPNAGRMRLAMVVGTVAVLLVIAVLAITRSGEGGTATTRATTEPTSPEDSTLAADPPAPPDASVVLKADGTIEARWEKPVDAGPETTYQLDVIEPEGDVYGTSLVVEGLDTTIKLLPGYEVPSRVCIELSSVVGGSSISTTGLIKCSDPPG